MNPAFPSPATVKPNGHVEDERLEGMSERTWLLGQMLRGFAGECLRKGVVETQEIESVAEACQALVDRLV